MKTKKVLKRIRSWEKPISTVLGIAVVIVAGVLIFNFFKSQRSLGGKTSVTPSPEIAEQGKQGEVKQLPAVHTVKKGEYLWSIAEMYYGSGYNWVDIARANKLSQPNYITVGEKLTIPAVSVRRPQKKNGQLASGHKIVNIDTYTVARGDNLWKIAVAVYGDGYQWVKVYQANREAIGNNPGLIFAGTKLSLP